jgi:hypothetical protein
MFKKTICGVAFVLFLSGCDDKSEIKEVVSQGQQATHDVSKTALYLPGGAGVDFGRMPIRDEVIEDEHSKIRIAAYTFNESYEEIDNSFASVVEVDGYVRTVHAPGKDKLSVSYRKQGANPVLTRYALSVQEGVGSKTILTISWRFK